MAAIVAVLVTVSVSLLITRAGTSALVHTGLSREVARFQARSAFFGVGFTTSEAESVVNHPVRRRIVLWLVVLGNAGIVTVVASVVLSASSDKGLTPLRLAILAAGLGLLALVARTRLGDTVLHAGDVLVVYGREERVCELDDRTGGDAGDAAHAAAVAEQERLEAEEEVREAIPAQ